MILIIYTVKRMADEQLIATAFLLTSELDDKIQAVLLIFSIFTVSDLFEFCTLLNCSRYLVGVIFKLLRKWWRSVMALSKPENWATLSILCWVSSNSCFARIIRCSISQALALILKVERNLRSKVLRDIPAWLAAYAEWDKIYDGRNYKLIPIKRYLFLNYHKKKIQIHY